MARSLKKNPFVANHLSRKIEKLNMREEKEIIGHKLGEFAPTLTFARHARNDKKSRR
uniref:Ribosomal protein S19 n=1 Tax=Allium strictum TaxID=165662 RepID=A0A6M8TWB5_9ASPA|nr:ribosomal protein S19 [Allium strictum]QKJ81362.1 ribosomal protein S19 [Allium strictum]